MAGYARIKDTDCGGSVVLGDMLRSISAREVWGSFTWDAPSCAANTTTDTTLTSASLPVLSQLRPGHLVTMTPPSTLAAGIVVGGAWVPASGQLTIRLGNLTGAPVDPASGTWLFSGRLVT